MRDLIGLTALVGTMLVVSMPAQAGTTYTFVGGHSSNDWGDSDNWNPSTGFPIAGDSAIIPSGKTCNILNNANRFAADIDVQGTLVIVNDTGSGAATLTITDDSTVDGTLEIQVDAELIIADDLTITGNGGDIHVHSGSSTTEGEIKDNGTAYELTLANQCGQDPLDESCSAMIHGNGEINVKLNNNGIVRADTCVAEPETAFLILELNEGTKRGNGNWEATCTGTLQVNTQVTGAGAWFIHDSVINDAKISINECLMDLSGKVNIGEGTLDVNANFCTTGLLNYRADPQSPYITVAAGHAAQFSVASCGSCPE